jgi:hypothetical protein
VQVEIDEVIGYVGATHAFSEAIRLDPDGDMVPTFGDSHEKLLLRAKVGPLMEAGALYDALHLPARSTGCRLQTESLCFLRGRTTRSRSIPHLTQATCVTLCVYLSVCVSSGRASRRNGAKRSAFTPQRRRWMATMAQGLIQVRTVPPHTTPYNMCTLKLRPATDQTQRVALRR